MHAAAAPQRRIFAPQTNQNNHHAPSFGRHHAVNTDPPRIPFVSVSGTQTGRLVPPRRRKTLSLSRRQFRPALRGRRRRDGGSKQGDRTDVTIYGRSASGAPPASRLPTRGGAVLRPRSCRQVPGAPPARPLVPSLSGQRSAYCRVPDTGRIVTYAAAPAPAPVRAGSARRVKQNIRRKTAPNAACAPFLLLPARAARATRSHVRLCPAFTPPFPFVHNAVG